MDEIFFKYRNQIFLLLIGAILIGFGALLVKGENDSSNKIEVLESATESQGQTKEIVVEVSGAVEAPGVYKLPADSRIEDALIAAGGISVNADRVWLEKSLNRAAKLIDGQKIYIFFQGESTGGEVKSGFVNINTASQKELESLWGIGRISAQNIIEHRPYSTVEELLVKKILKKNVYERNKDKLTVY
jgi:competence protein ComEA